MYGGSRKPEGRGAELGLNPAERSPPTIEGSSHSSLLGNLGHLLPSDKAINPTDVYAITGEQLMLALQSAIAVGQSQHSCKQCERWSVRPPNVPLPTFDGSDGNKGGDAKKFLRKLENYVASQRYTYAEALEMVVPCALDGPVGLWWEVEREKFKTWHDFLRSFKKEYRVDEYNEIFRTIAEKNPQDEEELLVDFISTIVCCYREFSPRATDQEVIEHILKKAHPECRILLKQKVFRTIEELKAVAVEVDETWDEMKLYRQSTEDESKSTSAASDRTSSPATLVKEDSPELTPTKEANAPKTWNSGKVHAVAPNHRFKEKDVFLPPWAEKDQPRKQFGANSVKSTSGKPSFNKFQKTFARKVTLATNVLRCYNCWREGHTANNCRKPRFKESWQDAWMEPF